MRFFLLFGTGAAGLAVAAGAFGAHALEGRVTAGRLEVFETAVRYQMYHALALLFVGWAGRTLDSSVLLAGAGGCFAAGIVIFSGSLYLLVLTDTGWLGAVAPIGGVAFLAGWGLLAWALVRGV
ncbi:MAG: DUF423 domain-containing protein [Bacteroidetes bacterium QS_8_68_28]|jgi:uncharacterized membrane protein YgdD (TMEM256/DUF423 family)|nr:MAG: DUF423 domain-containing protein [Bacteroidetes bacterium QS_8_68_28]